MKSEIKFEINSENGSRATIVATADNVDELKEILRTVQCETRKKVLGLF